MTTFADTFNYHCNHKGLYRKEVDKESGIVSLKYIARPIYIKDVIRLLDTEEIFWNVRFYFNDGWHEEVIARQNISERNITLLLIKGADVGGWKTKQLINYFFESEFTATPSYQHKFLGWSKYKNQTFYAHQQLTMPINTIKSNYVGNFNLAKKGQKSKWLHVIKKQVVGHAELELALCMGFSAVLVGYMNQKLNIHTDSLIFHISGNSTIGKTTAATVAVASFGDPKEGAKSLIQSFNGTENALVSLVSNNNGVPIVCDETSLSLMPTSKLINLIYSWAKNVDKARSDKNGDIRKRSGWGTTIITTGEGSLVEQVNQNEGIRARVLEFKNLQWTKSAEHSERLVEALSMNYGHGVQAFINHLNTFLPNDIYRKWKTEINNIKPLMPDSKFVSRISKKFALVILAAEILNEVFKFNLDIDAIRNLLIAQEQESLEERAIGPKIVEHLKEWLLSNQKHFVLNKVQPSESQQIWGRIDIFRPNNKTIAYILPSAFEKLLRQYQYSDKSIVLRELDQLGLLVKEKDAKQNKYHTRRVIKGHESSKNGLTVYGIKFDSIFLQVDAMYDPTRRKGKKVLMIDEREPEIVGIEEME